MSKYNMDAPVLDFTLAKLRQMVEDEEFEIKKRILESVINLYLQGTVEVLRWKDGEPIIGVTESGNSYDFGSGGD